MARACHYVAKARSEQRKYRLILTSSPPLDNKDKEDKVVVVATPSMSQVDEGDRNTSLLLHSHDNSSCTLSLYILQAGHTFFVMTIVVIALMHIAGINVHLYGCQFQHGLTRSTCHSTRFWRWCSMQFPSPMVMLLLCFFHLYCPSRGFGVDQYLL